MRSLLWLALLPLAAPTALAQLPTGRVTGTVVEAQTGQPIPDTRIAVVGTNRSTRTGPDGRYTLAGLPAGRQRIRAVVIGYSAAEDTVVIASGESRTVDFRLQQVAVSLNQVVVIGYGTQRRADLTGAVASIRPRVEETPFTSVEQALQGQAAGVQVTQASSAPGGGISIRVRGGSSVTGNNEPLYVIDGFPIENDPEDASPSDGGRPAETTVPTNPLSVLNPSDIQSIEILKDASATAIYGARGANGVVIITTKRGRAGRPQFTLTSYTGTQSVAHRYDLLDAQGFATFVNAWSAKNGTGTVFANPAALGRGTDWQDQVFRSAPIRNLQLGLLGGSTGENATRYALSGGVFQQEGVVRGSDFRRLSVRGNLDQSVGSRFRATSNLLVSRVSSSMVPTDGSFNDEAGAVGAALQYYPTLPVRRPDSSYTLLQEDVEAPLSPSNVPNPVSLAADVTDQLGDTRTLANVSGAFDILSGLTIKTSVGADLSSRTRDTYYPRTTLRGAQVSGYALRGRSQVTSFLNENTLSYTRQFGSAHDLSALVGYTRQSNDLEKARIENTGFVSDITSFEDIGAGTQEGGPEVSSGHSRWTLASYLGRLNYSLLDRYLFTVTARRDGSSRFGAKRRWGVFPSAAVAWRISGEPFMRRVQSVDELKLRASIGRVGNPSIHPYQSLSRLGTEQYTFGGTVVPGYYPNAVGNANLGWETTQQSDLGLDLALWQDRVSITGDLYRKRTSDLLLAVNLPLETGFASALQNIGAVENNGVELSVRAAILRDRGDARRLGWTTTLTYTRNRNRVLDLGGPERIFASSINSDLKLLGTLVQVGQPLGVFYGYKTDGIFRDSASAANYDVEPLPGKDWQAGDARLVDVNGDGAITADDRTVIGDPNPAFTGGLENTLTYRGVTLSSLFDFSRGARILNLNMVRLQGGSPTTNITRERFLNSWTPDNPNAKYPRIGFTPGTIGSDITSDLLEDGSYVRLRSITLEYALPARLLARAGLSQTRLYVTGTNLVTWTKYSGFSPDVSSLGIGNVNRGIDIGAYPLAKSIIFGLTLGY